MTIKSQHYYTELANTNNLQPPQMFQGTQYAMGESSLKLPLYTLRNDDVNERAKSVIDDFEAALKRIGAFATTLMRKKMPNVPVESSSALAMSHTVAVRGLIHSVAPATRLTTGHLTDFRIETVHPGEIQEGIMRTFQRSGETRRTDPVPDSAVYLLSSAKVVQGSNIRRLGSITEVAPQGEALPDDGGFSKLYDAPTYLTVRVGVSSELLNPALYKTPTVLRVSDAQLF